MYYLCTGICMHLAPLHGDTYKRHISSSLRGSPVEMTKYTEEYWLSFLKANKMEWVGKSAVWKKLWGKAPPDMPEDRGPVGGDRERSEYPVIVEEETGYGFVILVATDKDFTSAIEVHAACVDRHYRQQGILKRMWQRIEEQYPGRTFFVDDMTPFRVWKKLGFAPKRADFWLGSPPIPELRHVKIVP
jgi:hypothetical protein